MAVGFPRAHEMTLSEAEEALRAQLDGLEGDERQDCVVVMCWLHELLQERRGRSERESLHDRVIAQNLRYSTEVQRLKMANKRLRALMTDLVEDLECEGCPMRRDCDDNGRAFCNISYHALEAIRDEVRR